MSRSRAKTVGVGSGASVEGELWNVFTYYTLLGEGLQSTKMSFFPLRALCRDCGVVEELSGAPAAGIGGDAVPQYGDVVAARPIDESGLDSILKHEVLLRGRRHRKALDKAAAEKDDGKAQLARYTAAAKALARAEADIGTPRLDFGEWVNCLLTISARMFPTSAETKSSAVPAFQRLLLEHILPRACRRNPQSIKMALRRGPVLNLRDELETALGDIFERYAAKSFASKARFAVSTGAGGVSRSARGGGGQSPGRLAANRHRPGGVSPGVRRVSIAVNTTATSDAGPQVAYAEWLRFASDFGLSVTGFLSTLELGDIFLTAIMPGGGDESSGASNAHTYTEGQLSFPQFWEALVRCSLQAMRDKTHVISTQQKVKALFLWMWNFYSEHADNRPDQTGVRSHEDQLAKASVRFRRKFKLIWERDGFPDYLERADVKHTATARQKATLADDLAIEAAFAALRSPSSAVLGQVAPPPKQEAKDADAKTETRVELPVPLDQRTRVIGDARINAKDLGRLVTERQDIGRMLASVLRKVQ